MGAVNNTDNLGNKLKVGDHVGYIYDTRSHVRIHSGIVKKLCLKNVWIEPDEYFKTDARYPEEERNTELFYKFHPNHKFSQMDNWYLSPYGRTVKLGY